MNRMRLWNYLLLFFFLHEEVKLTYKIIFTSIRENVYKQTNMRKPIVTFCHLHSFSRIKMRTTNEPQTESCGPIRTIHSAFTNINSSHGTCIGLTFPFVVCIRSHPRLSPPDGVVCIMFVLLVKCVASLTLTHTLCFLSYFKSFGRISLHISSLPKLRLRRMLFTDKQRNWLSEFHYFSNWTESVAVLHRPRPVYFVIIFSLVSCSWNSHKRNAVLPVFKMQVPFFLCLLSVGFVAAQSGPKITETVCRSLIFGTILFLEFHIVSTCPEIVSNRNEW